MIFFKSFENPSMFFDRVFNLPIFLLFSLDMLPTNFITAVVMYWYSTVHCPISAFKDKNM
jgi:hypothetical protein